MRVAGTSGAAYLELDPTNPLLEEDYDVSEDEEDCLPPQDGERVRQQAQRKTKDMQVRVQVDKASALQESISRMAAAPVSRQQAWMEPYWQLATAAVSLPWA